MPQAIPYQRFSSQIQSKGSTLERQQMLIEQWLAAHPEIEQASLRPIDRARSGFRGEHLQHGFGQILSAIESGAIKPGDYILVEAIDRIGRLEPLTMITLISEIVRTGVKIVTLEDEKEYSQASLNSQMSDLYILVGKIQQAHEYSKNLSRRISASYESKRAKARNGKPIRLHSPFWLNSNGKIVPEKAQIVLDCIELYLKGRGTRQILIDLMEKYPEVSKIHPTTLKRWFTNRALIGEWDTNNEFIPNVYEPLIEPKVFYALQRQVKARSITPSTPETYSLSGLVSCDQCGSSFHYRRKKHRNRVIIYANCSAYLKRGKLHCPNNTTIPYEVLVAFFEITYPEHLQNVVSDLSKSEDEELLVVLKSRLEEINKKIDSLVRILEVSPHQENTIDRIRLLDIEKRSLKAEIKLQEDKVTEDIASFNEDIVARLHSAWKEVTNDPITLREILKRTGYKIMANGRELHTATGPSGREAFTLIRRSTKYKCYFAEYYQDSYKVLSANDECTWHTFPATQAKYAINYNGVIVSNMNSGTWEEFIHDNQAKLDFALQKVCQEMETASPSKA